MMDVFIAFALSWICTVSGVALGGFLVFRTKRESYEGLVQVKQPSGDAFNLDDGLGFSEPLKSSAELPKPIATANDAFVQQFAETVASRASSRMRERAVKNEKETATA